MGFGCSPPKRSDAVFYSWFLCYQVDTAGCVLRAVLLLPGWQGLLISSRCPPLSNQGGFFIGTINSRYYGNKLFTFEGFQGLHMLQDREAALGIREERKGERWT